MTIQLAIAQGYRWVGINGKPGTGDDPSDGDVVNFLDAQGHPFEATVSDASTGEIGDIGPSKPISQPSRQAGAADYPDPNTVTDPLEFAKQTYEAVRNDPKATPADLQTAAARSE